MLLAAESGPCKSIAALKTRFQYAWMVLGVLSLLSRQADADVRAELDVACCMLAKHWIELV